MNSKLINEITILAKFWRNKFPELREGQSLMNSLFDVNPILYKEITGSEFDCFYDDKKISAFWNKLAEH
jgi:hypothetical protein